MTGSVTRESLFEADEFAASWGEHQQARIERLFDLKATETGLPRERLRLCFRDRRSMELVDRQGNRTVYHPSGAILESHPGRSSMSMMLFVVQWVDPWGYPHIDERTFLEIQFDVVDEMAFSRHKRAHTDARARLLDVV
ncbi:hypothetical protein ACYPKM_01850 [Pseudomonas aeruginosa]